MGKCRIIIMGAGGRDFHNFNTHFRDNPSYEVMCFTAAQIEGITDRRYPPELSGDLYPRGIPIHPEEELPRLIKEHQIDQVVLAYSDLSHSDVMHKASLVLSAGSDFRLLGWKNTMLESNIPVISVCAVRTGSGKSMVTRKIMEFLKQKKNRALVVRHPMPYGDLKQQIAQKFESVEDCIKYDCTIEEREEYEQEIEEGNVVFAGVDYEKVLSMAEKDAQIIVWDGGNNDFPFFKPSLHLVIADPLRAGDEVSYYPGQTNLRMADAVIINKVNSASEEDVRKVRENVEKFNSGARIIETESQIHLKEDVELEGKRVLAVEDGPTITHGDMPNGAAWMIAKERGAIPVDPRPFLTGSLKKVFEKYSHIGEVLPAMGYSQKQIKELQDVINQTECDLILAGTPIDLKKLIEANKPIIRVGYELKDTQGGLKRLLTDFIRSHKSLSLGGTEKHE